MATVTGSRRTVAARLNKLRRDRGTAIQVTPGELAELATAVVRVRDQLQGTADLLHDYAPAMGSPVVTGALRHFVSGWRDGRKQICAEVDALSQMLAAGGGCVRADRWRPRRRDSGLVMPMTAPDAGLRVPVRASLRVQLLTPGDWTELDLHPSTRRASIRRAVRAAARARLAAPAGDGVRLIGLLEDITRRAHEAGAFYCASLVLGDAAGGAIVATALMQLTGDLTARVGFLVGGAVRWARVSDRCRP